MGFVWGFGISLPITYLAYKKGSLTLDGMAAATSLGLLLWGFAGSTVYFSMLAFFLSASALSHWTKKRVGAEAEEIQSRLEKSERRDYTQVAANGGAALILAFIFFLSGLEIFRLAAVLSFAVANGDTWASELGGLSSVKPITLIGRKSLEKGLSGGVTPLGHLASFGGAAVIALTYFFLEVFAGGEPSRLFFHALIIVGVGFFGALLDSILGELVQAKYQELREGHRILTEKRKNGKEENLLVGGYRWVNNNMVNFLSTILASFLGGLLFFLR